MLALVFTTRKKTVVLESLLQSCSSVRRVVERNEIYTLDCGKTSFGCRARFFPTSLSEPLHAIVGVVTQLFLKQILPANHQKDGRSYSGSIQTNSILALPPLLPLGRSSLWNINRPEFPQSKLPTSLFITTIPTLFFLYLHCNAYEFWMVSMLEMNEFGSSMEIVHKFGMISAYNRRVICEYSVRKDLL
jgi:hypothetical protein